MPPPPLPPGDAPPSRYDAAAPRPYAAAAGASGYYGLAAKMAGRH